MSSIENRAHGPGQLRTECAKEHQASIICSTENFENKDTVCEPEFEAYKACRQEEQRKKFEARLAAQGVSASNSSNSFSSWFNWGSNGSK